MTIAAPGSHLVKSVDVNQSHVALRCASESASTLFLTTSSRMIRSAPWWPHLDRAFSAFDDLD
jgi:hypothetical protein